MEPQHKLVDVEGTLSYVQLIFDNFDESIALSLFLFLLSISLFESWDDILEISCVGEIIELTESDVEPCGLFLVYTLDEPFVHIPHLLNQSCINRTLPYACCQYWSLEFCLYM